MKTVTFPFILSSHRKTTTMQRKNWISFGFIAALLVASMLILNASTPKKVETVCCKKDLKKCSETETRAPKETPMENLSHQFITLPGFLH